MTSLTIELSNIGTSCHYACEIQQVSTPLRLVLTSDSPNGFWKLSEEIFNRISDKSEHLNYLLANRDFFFVNGIDFYFLSHESKIWQCSSRGRE